jgi:hypothetical protein
LDSQEGVNFRKKKYPGCKENHKPCSKCPIDLIPEGFIQEGDSLKDSLENIDNIKRKGRGEEFQDNVEMRSDHSRGSLSHRSVGIFISLHEPL